MYMQLFTSGGLTRSWMFKGRIYYVLYLQILRFYLVGQKCDHIFQHVELILKWYGRRWLIFFNYKYKCFGVLLQSKSNKERLWSLAAPCFTLLIISYITWNSIILEITWSKQEQPAHKKQSFLLTATCRSIFRPIYNNCKIVILKSKSLRLQLVIFFTSTKQYFLLLESWFYMSAMLAVINMNKGKISTSDTGSLPFNQFL